MYDVRREGREFFYVSERVQVITVSAHFIFGRVIFSERKLRTCEKYVCFAKCRDA